MIHSLSKDLCALTNGQMHSVMNQPRRYRTEEFYLKSPLYFIYTTLPLPPKPMRTTDYYFLFYHSYGFLCPEWHVIESIKEVAFLDWLHAHFGAGLCIDISFQIS